MKLFQHLFSVLSFSYNESKNITFKSHAMSAQKDNTRHWVAAVVSFQALNSI